MGVLYIEGPFRVPIVTRRVTTVTLKGYGGAKLLRELRS